MDEVVEEVVREVYSSSIIIIYTAYRVLSL